MLRRFKPLSYQNILYLIIRFSTLPNHSLIGQEKIELRVLGSINEVSGTTKGSLYFPVFTYVVLKAFLSVNLS